jgi:hypothetical protein
MEPRKLAQLLTEDVNTNNGLLTEEAGYNRHWILSAIDVTKKALSAMEDSAKGQKALPVAKLWLKDALERLDAATLAPSEEGAGVEPPQI